MRAKTALMLMLLAVSAGIGSGCSSNAGRDLIEEKPGAITDPVHYEISGLNGDLLDNTEAFLKELPEISAKRSRVYLREIRESVRRALRAYGYYHPDIKITPPPRGSQDTLIKIEADAGKPLFIRDCRVQILGEGANYRIFANLIEKSGLASYTRLNHGAYETLKADLKSQALALGFFDARMVISRILVYPNQNVADIELIFDTGKRYRFGEIKADARTIELMYPARKLMTVEQGKPFSSAAMNDYISSMAQTGYYSSVDVQPRLDQAHDYEVPLAINLERKPKNLMRLGLGYSTDDGPRILTEWDKPLLNRYGHSLMTHSKLSAVTQDAQIVYKIPRKNPNLDYYYINAAQIHTDFNDTLSDRSHLSLHYVANTTGVWRRDYALQAEYEDYTQGAEEGYGWNLMPSLLLSRRESTGSLDPKQGYALSLALTGATEALSDYTFGKAEANFKTVMSPTENTRLLFRLRQGALMGRDAERVPPSLRFFTGGDNSIRGFGYMDKAPHNAGGLKGAKYLSEASLEYQFPTGFANQRAAVFVDAGTATDDYSDNLLFGPGLGYRYVSSLGTVRADLAFGFEQNEGFDGVRLHFAFGPEF